MARTKQQQLEDVDAAIAAIERGSQSFTTATGVSVSRADLKTLYAKREQLEGEVTLESLGGPAAGIQEIGLGRIN